MPDDPGLPFRLLRRGLSAASRASASMVERVLRNSSDVGPFAMPIGRALRRNTGPVEIVFGGTAVRASAGATLLDAARSGGIDLRHYCGGNCSCGSCRVIVLKGAKNLSRREGMEEMTLGAEHTGRGDRLACQARAHGPVEVRIPEWF